jgi:hypothetical protein
MRVLFALCLALLACSADPVLLPDAGPCSSACGPGTVCMGGACVAVDGGALDVLAVDVGAPGEDRPAPVDLGSPVDVGFDAGPADAGPADTGADVPVNVDPRQSEVCRAVNATCDGRIVDVQRGERDGGLGQTFHCGGCGITCAAGSFCVSCVCER